MTLSKTDVRHLALYRDVPRKLISLNKDGLASREGINQGGTVCAVCLSISDEWWSPTAG